MSRDVDNIFRVFQSNSAKRKHEVKKLGMTHTSSHNLLTFRSDGLGVQEYCVHVTKNYWQVCSYFNFLKKSSILRCIFNLVKRIRLNNRLVKNEFFMF